MTQQGLRQQSVRDITGTAYDYNGDWHALFDVYGIPTGEFNGRLLAWINSVMGESFTELNGAMQAFAEDQGAANWSSLGTFLLFDYYGFSGGTPPGTGTTADPFVALADVPFGDGISFAWKYGSDWKQESIVNSFDNQTFAPWGDENDGPVVIDGEGVANYCISLSGDNNIIRGVTLRAAIVNDGCLVMSGRNSLAENFIAEDGGLHTGLIADGTWRNGVVRNGSGASLVEIFDAVGGGSVTLEEVDTTLDVYDSGMAGIDAHTAGGGVTMNKVTIIGGLSENVGGGISLSNEILEAEIDGRTFDGVLSAITVRQDALVKNITDVNGVAGGDFFTVGAPNVSVVLENLSVNRSLFNTRLMGSGQPGISVLYRGDSVFQANAFSVFAFGFYDYGDIQFGEPGDEIYLDTQNYPYAFINGRGDGTSTLTTPANYTIPTWSFAVELNGNTYSGQSQIQGAGLFLNATIGGPP